MTPFHFIIPYQTKKGTKTTKGQRKDAALLYHTKQKKGTKTDVIAVKLALLLYHTKQKKGTKTYQWLL